MTLYRMIDTMKYALKWSRALNHAAAEQWEAARALLLSMGDALFLEARPENVEPQSLYVLVAHRLGHHGEALRVLELAMESLNAADGRIEIERHYLMANLEMQRLLIEDRPFDECSGKLVALTNLCARINIDAVPKRLKMNFPLVESIISDPV